MRRSMIVLVALVAIPSPSLATLPSQSLLADSATSATLPSASGSDSTLRTLTHDERVAAQRVIEEVFWRHRQWPTVNRHPKPPLAEVMPDDAIRSIVDDYLVKSMALAVVWERPVTAAQLQQELDRIARDTRDPGVLREIFLALGNDACLLAETLARRTLVDRLARNWYAFDDRIHGAVKRAAFAAASRVRDGDELRVIAPTYHQATYELSAGSADHSRQGTPHEVVTLDVNAWASLRRSLAQSQSELVGNSGAKTERNPRVNETRDSFLLMEILDQSAIRMTIGIGEWPERPFDSWWLHLRESLSSAIADAGGAFQLPTIKSESPCQNDTLNRPGFSGDPTDFSTRLGTHPSPSEYGLGRAPEESLP